MTGNTWGFNCLILWTFQRRKNALLLHKLNHGHAFKPITLVATQHIFLKYKEIDSKNICLWMWRAGYIFSSFLPVFCYEFCKHPCPKAVHNDCYNWTEFFKLQFSSKVIIFFIFFLKEPKQLHRQFYVDILLLSYNYHYCHEIHLFK